MRATRHAKLDGPTLPWPALAQAVVLVFIILLAADARSEEAIRIGYVDMKRLFETAPQVVAARESLDGEFRPRNEALLADENRLQELEQALAESRQLDAETRLELERDIRNLRRSIDRRREDLREELRFRTSTATQALEETIEVAVQQVAETRGYDLILTSPVAYAAASIDITDYILDWLAEDFDGRDNGR
ncbi:OmpH family outer membrane protein [Wenzhouxiangella limi]|uniref:OmpH family outer membrane protein n=1 Tax=Wenzhouxiangella limi TaxID=2707351 RepID=A0A845V0Z4_9GAMM|nr:OmpH family outer membrane protein [Wenzhouxiangella limi]NDY94936.1 OmpH family outer membrane protein [Wenzhouxiangella limi]